MRADDRAENVVRGLDARHPVAHRFVDGVAKRARAAGDRPHFGPQQLHAEHVGRLPADVFLAHVDDAFEAEMGTGGGGGDAVLAGAGFGDHPLLAHPQREQALAERVVDLVGAGVVEILALEPDLGSAALFAEPLGEIQRRRPADVVLPERRQFRLKRGVLRCFVVLDGQARRGRESAFPARSGRRTRRTARRRRELVWLHPALRSSSSLKISCG